MTAWATAVTAAGAFAVTNVDDVVVITALFTTSHTAGAPTRRAIVLGQYLGFGALVVLSVVGAVGLHSVSDAWVGVLGAIPLALGGRALWRVWTERADPLAGAAVPVRSLGGVAAVTFANGADNVSIYIPLFRRAGAGGATLTIVVFLALLAVWCVVGARLGRQPFVLRAVDRAGHVVVPLLFIVIGFVILVKAGTIGALFSR